MFIHACSNEKVIFNKNQYLYHIHQNYHGVDTFPIE